MVARYRSKRRMMVWAFDREGEDQTYSMTECRRSRVIRYHLVFYRQLYLASEVVGDDPMTQLLGHSITYRIAVWPQRDARCLPCRRCPPVIQKINLAI